MRKITVFTLFLMGLLAAVVACSQTADDDPLQTAVAEGPLATNGEGSIPPITLRVAVRQGDISAGLMASREEWEAATGVQIDFQNLSHAFLQERIFTDVQDGRGDFDVIMVDDPWFPSLAGNGYLMPLSVFGYHEDPDFLDRSLDLSKWPPPRGPIPPNLNVGELPQLYALPLVGNVQMFWYNQTLVPEPPRTIAQLITTLSETARPEDGIYAYTYTGGAGNPIVTEFNAWNWSYGGRIFDENWNVVVNQPTSVQALEDWMSLLALSNHAQNSRYRSSSDTGRELLSGRALGAVVWPANIERLMNEHGNDRVDVNIIPFPANATQTSQIGHWLLAIPTTSRHKQEAYNYVLWATSKEIMRQSAALGLPPTRKSVYEDAALQTQYPWYPNTRIAIEQATWRPRTPQWTKVEHILGNELSRALNGEMSAQEALDKAASEIQIVMAQANYYD